MTVEPTVQRFLVTEPYLDISCSLGEGPFWEESNRCLRFVDINKKQIHIVLPDEGPASHRVLIQLDQSIGHTADIDGQDEQFVFGGKAGFEIFNRKTGTHESIAKFWDGKPDALRREHVMRANDGGVDFRGRYLLGVMNDPLIEPPGPVGAVLRLDPDKSVHTLLEGISIPNGIKWSEDGRVLYIADSPTGKIFTYDYDIETGNVSNKRVFFEVSDDGVVPDGQAIDVEGYMWSALYGSGKVVRISPDGRIVAEIQLPTRCITCPVFVDDWLYITSAEEEKPERFPESVRYQGAVFRCKVGVKGLPIHKFMMHSA